MKKELLIAFLCLAIVLPVCIAGAQETEDEGAATTQQAAPAESKDEGSATTQQAAPAKSKDGGAATTQQAAPAKSKDGGAAVAKQAEQVKNTATGWISKIIAFISQIGAVFGGKLGFRIGGTTGTAIATLAVAKLAQDKLPSWAKWLLYLTGGTMFAGSGANIAEMVMSSL
jgi:uncharacterized membrane protein